MQLLVKGRERAAVRAVAIEVARAAAALPRSVRAALDTDPYAML